MEGHYDLGLQPGLANDLEQGAVALPVVPSRLLPLHQAPPHVDHDPLHPHGLQGLQTHLQAPHAPHVRVHALVAEVGPVTGQRGLLVGGALSLGPQCAQLGAVLLLQPHRVERQHDVNRDGA